MHDICGGLSVHVSSIPRVVILVCPPGLSSTFVALGFWMHLPFVARVCSGIGAERCERLVRTFRACLTFLIPLLVPLSAHRGADRIDFQMIDVRRLWRRTRHKVLVALALVCVPVVPAPFPRSSPRIPPYDTVPFLCARSTACTPFSTALYSRVAPSLLTQSHRLSSFVAVPRRLPLLSRLPSLLFLPCAFPALPFASSAVPCRPCLPSSPLRLVLPRASSPLSPSSPYLDLPAPVSHLCHLSSPPFHPIVSPRVLVLPRIYTLLIPAPRPSRFFPHSVLLCFLPVQSPHPPSLPAPFLPRTHPSASPSISLSHLTALPILHRSLPFSFLIPCPLPLSAPRSPPPRPRPLPTLRTSVPIPIPLYPSPPSCAPAGASSALLHVFGAVMSSYASRGGVDVEPRRAGVENGAGAERVEGLKRGAPRALPFDFGARFFVRGGGAADGLEERDGRVLWCPRSRAYRRGSVRMCTNADVMQRAMWGSCRTGAYGCEARRVRTLDEGGAGWSARAVDAGVPGGGGGGDGVPQVAALGVWMPARFHERGFVKRASCARLRLRVVWMEWRRMLSAHGGGGCCAASVGVGVGGGVCARRRPAQVRVRGRCGGGRRARRAVMRPYLVAAWAEAARHGTLENCARNVDAELVVARVVHLVDAGRVLYRRGSCAARRGRLLRAVERATRWRCLCAWAVDAGDERG
ncbi:hypothetical protein DFH09DRAFT_1421774 [Mycena vulgaris]|nr:hypothetical protein DFH09DRAFT_1421774 [Mycena vulgaris]